VIGRPSDRIRNGAVFAIVVVVTFLVRVPHSPIVSPDGELYLRIADNVIANGCYSDSPPAERACHPTWANQPPGYPLFLAVSRVAGAPVRALPALQIFLYAVAAIYALACLRRELGMARPWVYATGLVLALSPLTIGWSHWILTETVAAAAALWLVADCIRSASTRTFRTGPLAISLAAATFVRWDLIWLSVPIMAVAWHLRRTPGILFRLCVVGTPVSTLIALLIARAAIVGLPLVPSALNAGPDELPPGIVTFWNVASTRQTATSGLLWRVWNRQYQKIADTFDYDSLSGRVDASAFRSVLRDLSSVPDGRPVPDSIDQRFAGLARDAVRNGPVRYWLSVWLARAASMWLHPDTLNFSGWLQNHEPYFHPYREVLLALVLLAPAFFPRGSALRVAAGGLVLFIIGRTAFLVVLNGLESRYLTPFIPAMELVAVALVWSLYEERPCRGHD